MIDDLAFRSNIFAEAKLQTLESLPAFLAKLTAGRHNYNTIVYAVAAAAVGAAWAVERSPSGGITGFQAGGVMWEFMEHWNGVRAPARLLRGEDMLYPQYADRFATISSEWMRWVREKATANLVEVDEGETHPSVRAHWQMLADGHVPFGLRLGRDES